MFNVNGPPKGSNVLSDQSSYDLIYRDIILSSDLSTYSNGYSTFNLSTDNINQIYKAELISATVVFNTAIPNEVKNSTLLLSIPTLNGNTLRVAGNNTGTNSYQGQMFCQIPDNNTPLIIGTNPSNNTISLLIGPHMYESIQYYNPPINKINNIGVQWYTKNGTLIPIGSSSGNITSFYCTLRVHYFQKRNNMTMFSTSVFTETNTGTVDSIFEPKKSSM